MFGRLFRGAHQGLYSRNARRGLTTLATASNAGGMKGKLGIYIGAAVVGTVLGLGVETAKNDESPWASFKENIMTSYEQRIRTYSTPEKIFHTFASVKKEDGRQYMTADDFIRALVPHQFQYESKADKRTRAKALPAAFKIADQNGDGLLSFQEYLFFVTLLSIPEKSFRVAFKLMDEDQSGKVDQAEFMRMMSLVKKLSPPATLTTTEQGGVAQGWLTHFFGANGQNDLTFETFSKFLSQLNKDVLKMEYDLYDREGRGFLSQRDFGFLMVSFANPKDFFERAVDLDSTPLKPFSFEQFEGFNDLIDHLDDVEMGMRLYQLNNRAFRKQDLQRLTSIVCKAELNQQVIDTIMRIFDKNRDGTLEIDEFVTAIRKRKTRGLQGDRDTGFTRSITRIYKCITNPDE